MMLVRERSASLLGLGLASLLACTGASQPPPGAPTGLGLRAASFDLLILTWVPPAEGAEGFVLEGRAGSGPWERMGVLPSNALGAEIGLKPELEELLQLEFRVAGARGIRLSAWASATWHRGVRAPDGMTAAAARSPGDLSALDPVTVAWTNRSLVATELQLERADLSAASPAYGPLPAAFGEQYRDADPLEARPQSYRVRYGAGGVWSDWARVDLLEPIPVLRPRNVSVVPLAGGGVRVRWEARSGSAIVQRLTRWNPDRNFTPLPDLPPGASEYVDPLPSYWPVLRYRVEAQEAGGAVAVSEVGQIAPYPVSELPGLRASGPLAPAHEVSVRDGAGRFHLSTALSTPARIYRALAAGWEERPLDGLLGAAPALAVDGSDRLHALFVLRDPVAQTDTVVHEWHDGTAWQRETLALAAPFGWFAAAADGALHAVATRNPQGSPAYRERALWRGSGWTVAALPSSGFTLDLEARYAVSGDGTAYLLVVGTDFGAAGVEARLRVEPPGGSWSGPEVVPGCSTRVWLLPADAGRAAVVCGDDAGLAFLRRRAAGGFEAAERVSTRRGTDPNVGVSGSSSADGDRALLVVSEYSAGSPVDDELWLRDSGQAGTWRSAKPGPGRAQAWWAGFGPAGKAWARATVVQGGPEAVPVALFEEP